MLDNNTDAIMCAPSSSDASAAELYLSGLSSRESKLTLTVIQVPAL